MTVQPDIIRSKRKADRELISGLLFFDVNALQAAAVSVPSGARLQTGRAPVLLRSCP